MTTTTIDNDLSKMLAREFGCQDKQCFLNSYTVLLGFLVSDPTARYVEGYATVKDGMPCWPVAHGWCQIDRGGATVIVDPTPAWHTKNDEVRYFPCVELTADELVETLDRAEEEGGEYTLPVVLNDIMINPDHMPQYDAAWEVNMGGKYSEQFSQLSRLRQTLADTGQIHHT